MKTICVLMGFLGVALCTQVVTAQDAPPPNNEASEDVLSEPQNHVSFARSSFEPAEALAESDVADPILEADQDQVGALQVITEREALARSRLSLSPMQIRALDELRENPILRSWDGKVSVGFELMHECALVILNRPCTEKIVETATGEAVWPSRRNNTAYIETGVGQEIVRDMR